MSLNKRLWILTKHERMVWALVFWQSSKKGRGAAHCPVRFMDLFLPCWQHHFCPPKEPLLLIRSWSRDAFLGFVGQGLVKIYVSNFLIRGWSRAWKKARKRDVGQMLAKKEANGILVKCWSSTRKKVFFGYVGRVLVKDTIGQALVAKSNVDQVLVKKTCDRQMSNNFATV